MAALCPFTADYTAVVLTETLAIFFTTAAVLVFVYSLSAPALDPPVNAASDLSAPRRAFSFAGWFLLLGFIAGLGTLVRPEIAAGAGRGRRDALHSLVAAGELAEIDTCERAGCAPVCCCRWRLGRREMREHLGAWNFWGRVTRRPMGILFHAVIFVDADSDDAIWRSVSGDVEPGESADQHRERFRPRPLLQTPSARSVAGLPAVTTVI